MKWLLKKLLASVIREVMEEREAEIVKATTCRIKRNIALGNADIFEPDNVDSAKLCLQKD